MIYFAHAGEEHASGGDSAAVAMIAVIVLALFVSVAAGIYVGKKRAKTAQPGKKTEIE